MCDTINVFIIKEKMYKLVDEQFSYSDLLLVIEPSF